MLSMQLRHCFTATKCKYFLKRKSLISSDIPKEIAPPHINQHTAKMCAGSLVLLIRISYAGQCVSSKRWCSIS